EGVCRKCEDKFHIEDYAFACPACGSTEIEVIGGQDLSIVEMEVD
ncbi:MAG: hydrogenase maturation nickel metallochaperone HypA, partial [Deltaproteobacteria bacterium]|nr:hydrogenase maturation nickel metallochaperone HypA [Deltaproteobacteria bacterium]